MTSTDVIEDDDMEATPKSITLPVLYEQQKGFRREMLGSIHRIEQVTDARYEKQQAEIDGVRTLTILRDDRLNRVETAVEAIAAQLEPIAIYFKTLQESDRERKAWRDRVGRFVFGSGMISFVLLVAEVVRWVRP